MIKKLFFSLTALMILLAACGGGDDEEGLTPKPTPEETASITIDSNIITNGVTFTSEGGEKSISFTATADWTLTMAATRGVSWCTASVSSGGKGSATVKFITQTNADYDDRSVAVTIKAGTASQTFTITQKCADALLITADKFEVEQAGGTIEVEVKANIDYRIEVSETAKGWITESSTRALTARKHRFDIAVSEEMEKREGEIYIKSGDKQETVRVYQSGGPILLLTKNEYAVSSDGETITVDVKSNVEYGVEMPKVDWVEEVTATRGASSHTLKFAVAPNEGYDSRSAAIVFYDKNSDLKETLTLTQAQKDAIILSQKEVKVSSEGETIEVKLNSNVDFEVKMPDADWIKRSDTRGLQEHLLHFVVSSNEGEEERSAEIVFTNKDSGIEEKLIVTQEGTMPKAEITINVAEAGTLGTYIAEDRIKTLTSLKIVGDLNGDDFYVITQMKSLIVLDLSEANIVSGGRSYDNLELWYSWGGVYESLYVETNMLKAKMIPRYIEYLYLPKSLEKIFGVKYRDYVFSVVGSIIRKEGHDNSSNTQSSALKSVELPSGLKEIGLGTFAYTKITNLSVPNNITKIGDYAFLDCGYLQEIGLGKGLKTIGERSFSHCESLSNINIPEGVEEIGKSAFYDCGEIRNIVLPTTLKKIGESAFSIRANWPIINVFLSDLNNWCNVELEDIYSSPFYIRHDYSGVNSQLYLNGKIVSTLEINDVVNVGNYLFAGCKSLEKVTIGEKIVSIGEKSFKECENIAEINIGNGVTTISDGAFEDCNKLNKVVLGKGLEKIEPEAFKNVKPEEVYCYAITPPSIASSSNFNKIEKEKAMLYVPKGTYSAYYLSDWGSIFTNIIEMEK